MKRMFAHILEMDEEAIIDIFSYLFFDMQYDEAMQIVGCMKMKRMDDARRLEMMLYFEQNKHAKIRSSLRGVLDLGTEEKEFYLTSLPPCISFISTTS